MALVFAVLAVATLSALTLALYGRAVAMPAALSRERGHRSSGPTPAPISTV
jgi:hypothetical protein